MPKSRPRALSIDVSDPAGDEGVQADLAAFAALGVAGRTACTGVLGRAVEPRVLHGELEVALAERVAAARTGTFLDAAGARVTAEALANKRLRLVVDPASTALDVLPAVAEHLLPRADLVRARPAAARVLTDVDVVDLAGQREAARILVASGARAALVTAPDPLHVDLLLCEEQVHELPRAKVPAEHARGAGAALSAACTAYLARGCDLVDAVKRGHAYVQQTLHRGVRHAMQPWYDRSGLDPEPTSTMTASDEEDARFMRRALELAKIAAVEGEVPVGAVLVHEGKVVGEGFNRREQDQDPLSHAELLAIAAGARALERWRLSDTTLYVTLEPCFMCAGGILNARIGRVVWGADDPKAGATRSLGRVLSDGRMNHRPALRAGVLAAECGEVLRAFFSTLRP